MRDAALPGLAVGFFDGVHCGHRAILAGAEVALTFRQHPLSVLHPERAPLLIMSCEERLRLLKESGVREVRMLDFTSELAAMSPEEFCRRHLLGYSVRCGANWRFGFQGAGDAEWLRRAGLPVTVVPYAEWREGIVSSSRIRAAIENGELDDAAAMLGRPFRVFGETFRGKGEGECLGFPTVNVRPTDLMLRLRYGVYAVEVAGVKAIANYGLAPTWGEQAWSEPILEVHFFGGAVPPLAPTPVVDLIRFIRPERKFASLAELQEQIARDCAMVVAL